MDDENWEVTFLEELAHEDGEEKDDDDNDTSTCQCNL